MWMKIERKQVLENLVDEENMTEPVNVEEYGKTMIKFLKKYFWNGQHLEEKHASKLESLAANANWQDKLIHKHRRLIGFLIPMAFFITIWLTLAVKYHIFSLFPYPDKYTMCITMIFGAMVAGMTSEGGGAVAFPVMTLALHVKPSVARDFSLMIQSCGMTAAAFTIFWMKIRLERNSIAFCSLGAIFGLIFGFYAVDPFLNPKQKKMAFVSIWFSFAVALFLNNYKKERKMSLSIENVNVIKIVALIAAGFLGGIFTSFSGSGVDVCSFSVLTLLFNISEKVATPTSVILMAINTVIGFYWRQLIMVEVEQESWEYFAVCVPIVVICAPFGSVLSSHFHRHVLAGLIYIIEIIALVSAFIIVKPDWILTLISIGIMLIGLCFFLCLRFIGHKLHASELKAAIDSEKSSVTNQTYTTSIILSQMDAK